jgi:DNA ligase-4
MRLLLPQLDRERGNYGLKESTLAKYYAEILLLPQNEAERLKHWKNPIKQVEGVVAGDFVGVLMSVMRKRAR